MLEYTVKDGVDYVIIRHEGDQLLINSDIIKFDSSKSLRIELDTIKGLVMCEVPVYVQGNLKKACSDSVVMVRGSLYKNNGIKVAHEHINFTEPPCTDETLVIHNKRDVSLTYTGNDGVLVINGDACTVYSVNGITVSGDVNVVTGNTKRIIVG